MSLINKYEAEQGFIFRNKSTGDELGSVLYLGINDSIDNYDQIKQPIDIIEGEASIEYVVEVEDANNSSK